MYYLVNFFFSLNESEMALNEANEKITFVIEEYEQNASNYTKKSKAIEDE